MPKRMLDDSFLTSPSIAKCSPRAQDAFPRFILLADDFGCFEALPRVLVAKAWPHRTDVTEDDVTSWLDEYAAAGMVRLWVEGERRYCYLTGWDGPHGQRKRVEYDSATEAGRKGSKRRTPRPPDGFPVDSRPGNLQPGNALGVQSEIASDSVPAREVRVSRSVPAPAVPVPVPVPGTTSAPNNGAPAKHRRQRPRDLALDALRADFEAQYFEAMHEKLDWRDSDYGDLGAIRKSLGGDDAEASRRWGLFLKDTFWPIKIVHKFRDAYTHPKFKRPSPPTSDFPAGIPVYR